MLGCQMTLEEEVAFLKGLSADYSKDNGEPDEYGWLQVNQPVDWSEPDDWSVPDGWSSIQWDYLEEDNSMRVWQRFNIPIMNPIYHMVINSTEI